jgi:hypothetical protein
MASRSAADGNVGARHVTPAIVVLGHAIRFLLIAAFSGGLWWLVSIYGAALRDPRYLDGWVLAGGMGLQLCFHVAVKTARLPPRSIVRWRKIHILVGYLLIAAFLSHCDFSPPDTGFEWALWGAFVVVTLTGIFGAYLSWALPAKRLIDERIGLDRIPARRAELARDVHAVVARVDPIAEVNPLPAPSDDAWIADLYANHLRDFFNGQRNFFDHLIGSQQPLKRLTDEIENLSRYVDLESQNKLAAIKNLVIEKDRLDFAAVHLGLTKGWLFVHVPVTYALIVLTILHVVIVYAFSTGIV